MKARSIHTQLAGALLTSVLCASPGMADVLTFYPTDDTCVSMRYPDSNSGSSTKLIVMNRYGHWSHEENWEKDILTRFDLSSIPPGTDISSATLHLYYYHWHDNNPAGRKLTCYRVTSDWDEDTVTWNTRPNYASQYTCDSNVPSGPGVWMDWDVTADVQAFVNDAQVDNYGWQIMDEKYWGYYDIPRTYFRSKEYGAFIPYLEVVPEPTTLALLAFGGFALMRRRLVS